MRLTSPLGYLFAVRDRRGAPRDALTRPRRPYRRFVEADDTRGEERAAQSILGWAAHGPGTHRNRYETMIAAGQVGSLLNVTRAEQVNYYQRIAIERSRLHIPLLFGLDVIHGFRTIFPVNLGLSSTWAPALIEETSRAGGRGGRGRRCPMDLFPDGGYCARRPMGTHRRELSARIRTSARCWREPYVRGYQGQDLHDLDLDSRLRETLRRVWRGGGRARLQHHRDLRALAAPGLSEPVPRHGRGGGRYLHVCLQFAERRAGERERVYPARHLARGVGLRWSGRERLGRRRGDDLYSMPPMERPLRASRSWPGSTWIWRAASMFPNCLVSSDRAAFPGTSSTNR